MLFFNLLLLFPMRQAVRGILLPTAVRVKSRKPLTDTSVSEAKIFRIQLKISPIGSVKITLNIQKKISQMNLTSIIFQPQLLRDLLLSVRAIRISGQIPTLSSCAVLPQVKCGKRKVLTVWRIPKNTLKPVKLFLTAEQHFSRSVQSIFSRVIHGKGVLNLLKNTNNKTIR